MSLKALLFTPAERRSFEHTFLTRRRLEEQYANLEQQSQTAAFGMWVFLATEVMFFGVLFLGVAIYWCIDAHAIEKASSRLKWQLGGANTIILLVSSLTMALAVRFARTGRQDRVTLFLLLTAALGVCFLCVKGVEYYVDFRERLVPGSRFDADEWIRRGDVAAHEVGYVQIFLLLYWIMTATHALHVTIGIGAVLTMFVLARRGHFSKDYYAPVDVTGLYWHFVDVVWIFLLPALYLLGTHAV